MAGAMQTLMAGGLSQDNAAAVVGSLMQESGLNPLARNASGHVGIAQWDKSRQSDFAKQFGYQMGSDGVSASQQLNDQMSFLMTEFMGNHKKALAQMQAARNLLGKESAFMRYFEVVNDASFGRRYAFAQEALQLSGAGARSVANNDNSSEVHIGAINVSTNSDDPRAHAAAVRLGLIDQPLLNPQGTISLGTRGMVQ
jgi:hypothetical protein